MADLKTDYKDDVLDTSQNTKRKYEVIENPDGTISLVDVTEYLQEGDNFGADDINAITHAVNNIATDAEHTSYDNTESGLQATNVQDAVDEINDNLTELSEYTQLSTKGVYYRKYLRFVEVNILGTGIPSINGYYTLATLPVGFRPSQAVVFSNHISQDNTNDRAGSITINTDGTIVLSSWGALTTGWKGHAVYLV